jgi:WD40 repeat protein
MSLYLAVAADSNGLITLYDAETGLQVQELNTNSDRSILSINFDTSGRRIVCACGGEAMIFDTITGVIIRSFRDHKDIINLVNFSKGGRMVVSLSRDTVFKL